jgi:hypothetical protein
LNLLLSFFQTQYFSSFESIFAIYSCIPFFQLISSNFST